MSQERVHHPGRQSIRSIAAALLPSYLLLDFTFLIINMLNDFINSLPPAYRWPVQFCLFVTAVTYILSVITSNVSQVDRLWTFLPTIYTAYFALLPLWPNELFFIFPYSPKDLGWTVTTDFSPRALLMLGLTVIWTFRSVLQSMPSASFQLTPCLD